MSISHAIIAAFFGLLFGNYATTFYHRIPLNKPINGINNKIGLKPHCSKCKHPLKFYEYYPLIGWIITQLKCRYCGISIDKSYFYIEISSLTAGLLMFYLVGLNELFVMGLFATISTILFISLLISTKRVYWQVLAVTIPAILIFCYLLQYD